MPYIQNTCEHPTRTNGPIEGINNKIKVLKGNAYGFRNYYHFRNRIILITKMFGSIIFRVDGIFPPTLF